MSSPTEVVSFTPMWFVSQEDVCVAWHLGDDQPGDDDVVFARSVGRDGHDVVARRHVLGEFHADLVVGLVLILHFHGGRFGEGKMRQFHESATTLLRMRLCWYVGMGVGLGLVTSSSLLRFSAFSRLASVPIPIPIAVPFPVPGSVLVPIIFFALDLLGHSWLIP